MDVVGADGGALSIVGSVEVTIKYCSGNQLEKIYVAEPLRHPIILGLPWIRQFAPSFNWNDLSLTFATGEV